MADNKRLSLGVRVATPRLGNVAAPAMSVEAAIARCIGAKIRVTTVAPASQTYEQHLLAVSTAAATLTLTPTFPPATPQPRQLLVPLAAIQTFTLLALPPAPPAPAPSAATPNPATSGTTASSKAAAPAASAATAATATATAPVTAPPPPAPPAPPTVDPNAQAQRLRAAVERARAEEARRGKGVGRAAQDIFDALARTLPARWDGGRIVVLDAVVIAPPYRSEDCRAAKGVQPQMLARVRKVLESERKKIADKVGSPPPTEPRKGG